MKVHEPVRRSEPPIRGATNDAVRVSKRLSYWLRHRPGDARLELDDGGWAPVEKILAALAGAGLPNHIDDLRKVVADNDKNRFELSGDESSIRAWQGHSVAVDLDWPLANPPEHLFHGTVERFVAAIKAEGLKPMKRHHVHLSPYIRTATAVGARRGEAVILKIAAGRMAADGHLFRLTGNQVWLTERVPPAYIERFRSEEPA